MRNRISRGAIKPQGSSSIQTGGQHSNCQHPQTCLDTYLCYMSCMAPPNPAPPDGSPSATTQTQPGNGVISSGDNAEAEEVYSVFSPSTRTFLTYHLGFVMLVSTLTSTIYSPLIPLLATQFSVSIQAIKHHRHRLCNFPSSLTGSSLVVSRLCRAPTHAPRYPYLVRRC